MRRNHLRSPSIFYVVLSPIYTKLLHVTNADYWRRHVGTNRSDSSGYDLGAQEHIASDKFVEYVFAAGDDNAHIGVP